MAQGFYTTRGGFFYPQTVEKASHVPSLLVHFRLKEFGLWFVVEIPCFPTRDKSGVFDQTSYWSPVCLLGTCRSRDLDPQHGGTFWFTYLKISFLPIGGLDWCCSAQCFSNTLYKNPEVQIPKTHVFCWHSGTRQTRGSEPQNGVAPLLPFNAANLVDVGRGAKNILFLLAVKWLDSNR